MWAGSEKPEPSPIPRPEDLIRELPGNPRFKTYIIADQLFSLLKVGGEEEFNAITIPLYGIGFKGLVRGVQLHAAAVLGLPGAVELEQLVGSEDTIFIVASHIYEPEDVTGDPNSPLWDRTKEELIEHGLWHERIHMAMDRWDSALKDKLASAVIRSNNELIIGVREVVDKLYEFESGSYEYAAEVLAWILAHIRNLEQVRLLIAEEFSRELGESIWDMWNESRPSEEEVRQLQEIAQDIQSYVSDESYISIVRSFLKPFIPNTGDKALKILKIANDTGIPIRLAGKTKRLLDFSTAEEIANSGGSVVIQVTDDVTVIVQKGETTEAQPRKSAPRPRDEEQGPRDGIRGQSRDSASGAGEQGESSKEEKGMTRREFLVRALQTIAALPSAERAVLEMMFGRLHDDSEKHSSFRIEDQELTIIAHHFFMPEGGLEIHMAVAELMGGLTGKSTVEIEATKQFWRETLTTDVSRLKFAKDEARAFLQSKYESYIEWGLNGAEGVREAIEEMLRIARGPTPEEIAAMREQYDAKYGRPSLSKEAVQQEVRPTAETQTEGAKSAVTKPEAPVTTTEAPSPISKFLYDVHEVVKAGFAAKPIPANYQILLSESLFDRVDIDNLERLGIGGKESPIKILSPKDIRNASINQNTSKESLACVIAKSDYDDPELWNSNHKQQIGASLLVLAEDLRGSHYLYLEGVIGLARALMNDDKDAIKRYLGLLFERTEKGMATDDAGLLELLLNDPRKLADYIRFKPIEPVDTEELLNRYKADVENYLVAA